MNRSVSTINRFPPIRNIPLSRRFLRMESRQRSSLLLIIKKQSEIPPTMKSHPSEHRRSSDSQSFAAFHRVNICATVEIARVATIEEVQETWVRIRSQVSIGTVTRESYFLAPCSQVDNIDRIAIRDNDLYFRGRRSYFCAGLPLH